MGTQQVRALSGSFRGHARTGDDLCAKVRVVSPGVLFPLW
nr:MAG TPA: peroxisome biogenesis factor 1 [Caudoviricetes sp.]